MWNGFISVYKGFPLGLGSAVAVVCLVFSVLYVVKQRKKDALPISWKDWIGGIVFTLYMTFLLGGTLLCREIGEEYRFEWRLFWSYFDTFVKQDMTLWHQMIYNVLIFIPCGIFLPFLFKVKKGSVVFKGAVIFSFLIELIQLLFKLGLFELDDIFHNVMGAMLGYGIYYLCRKTKKMDAIQE